MAGYDAAWKDFRELYRARSPGPKPRARQESEEWLNIAERLLKPKLVSDLLDRDALARLRAHIASIPHHRSCRYRFAIILVALRWAEEEGLCPPIKQRELIDL